MPHTQQEHNLYQFAGRRNGYIPGRETFSGNLQHIGGTESVSLPGVPGLTRQVISYLRHINGHVRAPPGLGPPMAMLIKPEMPCLQSHLQGAVVGHLKDRGCRLKLACVPPFNVTTAITWPLCTSKAWPDTHDLSPAPCPKPDLKAFFFFFFFLKKTFLL